MTRSKRGNSDDGTAHQKSVHQILEAAQATWKAVTKLQAESDINPDGIFIEELRRRQVHPQKQAQAHLLGYHQLIANKTYWINAQDLWQEELANERGEEYTVRVPKDPEITVKGAGIDLENVETQEETLSLEKLSHRWSMRYVTVNKVTSDSWGSDETIVERKRIWLPPKAILYAFEQLEEVRTKIDLGADVQAPPFNAEKVLDPAEGLREPYSDQEGEG